MSEPKHSPGPWTLLEIAGHPLYIYAERGMVADFHELNEKWPRDKEFLEQVCRMRGVGAGMASDGTQAANARLIAAAPDLLAACEAAANDGVNMENDYRISRSTLEQLISAIDKATRLPCKACENCGGCGHVLAYSREDFEGEKDCPDCDGTGIERPEEAERTL